MSTKHTPGPWTLVLNPRWDRGGHGGDAKFAHISGDGLSVFALTTETQFSKEETLANALLISSAPDLLEAGKRALDYIEDFEKARSLKFRVGNELRAAIKKATGT